MHAVLFLICHHKIQDFYVKQKFEKYILVVKDEPSPLRKRQKEHLNAYNIMFDSRCEMVSGP